ncbi:hypothetical protein [Guptibacillus algicola]|uniref:hypothetical protein n=1 Tax=Guptibacillus algicola TaxID=225844 RepID=UPI001CD19D4D|nr:hypothetical protein [Alkalihalobacillus algicola]MCA0987193.1 hypothetical protein [Alkalihalobacillus algicola]
MSKQKDSKNFYVSIMVGFLILITLDRFVIDGKWFDYLYYFFMLSVITLLVVIHFKQKKWVYGSIFSLLLFWYLYGFQFM